MQPEACRAEGAAAATASHTSPGAVLQRKVPETRTHQTGTLKRTQQIPYIDVPSHLYMVWLVWLVKMQFACKCNAPIHFRA